MPIKRCDALNRPASCRCLKNKGIDDFGKRRNVRMTTHFFGRRTV